MLAQHNTEHFGPSAAWLPPSVRLVPTPSRFFADFARVWLVRGWRRS